MTYGYRFPYMVWLGERGWNSVSRGSTAEVFLYDDETDDPGQRAWMDAITTEPATGNYARQSVGFGGHDVSMYDNEVGVFFGEVTFDLSGVEETVDSFGIAAELEYVEGMGRSDQHTAGDMVEVFVGSGPLAERMDLSRYSGSWPVEAGASLVSMY